MVGVIGQREIAREIDFDAVAFPDRHRGHDVEKFVEDLRRRLRSALRKSLTHEVAPGRVECASGAGFAHGSERSDRKRDSEDAEVVVVDLISKTGIADLVEPFESVETDGITVGHERAVEHDSQTRLAKRVHLPGFAKKFRARRNQQVLAVVGVNVGGKQALDGSGKAAVETVDEHGFENGSFKQYVGFSCRRIGGGSRNGGRISCFLLSIPGCFPDSLRTSAGEIELGCISFNSWAICEVSGSEGSGVGTARGVSGAGLEGLVGAFR